MHLVICRLGYIRIVELDFEVSILQKVSKVKIYSFHSVHKEIHIFSIISFVTISFARIKIELFDPTLFLAS